MFIFSYAYANLSAMILVKAGRLPSKGRGNQIRQDKVEFTVC